MNDYSLHTDIATAHIRQTGELDVFYNKLHLWAGIEPSTQQQATTQNTEASQTLATTKTESNNE